MKSLALIITALAFLSCNNDRNEYIEAINHKRKLDSLDRLKYENEAKAAMDEIFKAATDSTKK